MKYIVFIRKFKAVDEGVQARGQPERKFFTKIKQTITKQLHDHTGEVMSSCWEIWKFLS